MSRWDDDRVNRSGLIEIGNKIAVGRTGFRTQVINYRWAGGEGAHPRDSFVKIFDRSGRCVDTALTVTTARRRALALAETK